MGHIMQGKVQDGMLLLTLATPRLEAAVARGFKSELDQIWAPGIGAVTVDLGTVEFIDSTGIGALLGLYKRLPQDGGGVTLVHVHPQVKTVIELLRLNRIFQLAPG